MSEWYCPNCEKLLIPQNVTYEETCAYCGNDVVVIDKDNHPDHISNCVN